MFHYLCKRQERQYFTGVLFRTALFGITDTVYGVKLRMTLNMVNHVDYKFDSE